MKHQIIITHESFRSNNENQLSQIRNLIWSIYQELMNIAEMFLNIS